MKRKYIDAEKLKAEMGKTVEGGSVLEYLMPHLWVCMNTFKCTKLQYIEV